MTFAGRPRLLGFIDDGSEILVNDEHKLKAADPTEVTEGGIVICFKEEHPRKAPL